MASRQILCPVSVQVARNQAIAICSSPTLTGGFPSVNNGAIRREADCDADFGPLYEVLADMCVTDLSAGIHFGETVINQLTVGCAYVNRKRVSRFNAEQSSNRAWDLKPRSALVYASMESDANASRYHRNSPAENECILALQQRLAIRHSLGRKDKPYPNEKPYCRVRFP